METKDDTCLTLESSALRVPPQHVDLPNRYMKLTKQVANSRQGKRRRKGKKINKKRVQKGVTGKRVGEVMHAVTGQVYRHNPRGHTMDDREAGGGNETIVVPGLGLVRFLRIHFLERFRMIS